MKKYLKDIFRLLLLICSLICYNAQAPKLKPKLLRFIPLQTEEDMTFDSGYVAGPNEIPYIVALEFTGYKSSWFCAGTIIQHRWILTVASCTNPAKWVKIVFSAADRGEPGYTVRVARRSFFAHPNFNKNYHHDIALIHMPYIKYSKRMRMVALPRSQKLFSGAWAFTFGWGQHKGNEKQANKLHVLQIKVAHNSNCSDIGFGKRFRSGMLCGQLPNMETSCHLDSGSPMVLQSSEILIGIASFGNQIGCKTSTPLGYTRITAYRDWMILVMSENS